MTLLGWTSFGTRIIEQHNILGNRRLYLMLFEDGNRIDLTLCPKDHINELVDSEAGFTVLVDEKGSFESYSPSPQRFWTSPASETDYEKTCNEFWWVSATWSKEFVVSKSVMQLTISTVFVSKNS